MQPERRAEGHVILCLNSGSSSLKFALYHLGEQTEVQLAEGDVTSVEVSLKNGEVLARMTQAPFKAFWALRAGTHVLIARATLLDGRVIESAPVRITVIP